MEKTHEKKITDWLANKYNNPTAKEAAGEQIFIEIWDHQHGDLAYSKPTNYKHLINGLDADILKELEKRLGKKYSSNFKRDLAKMARAGFNYSIIKKILEF